MATDAHVLLGSDIILEFPTVHSTDIELNLPAMVPDEPAGELFIRPVPRPMHIENQFGSMSGIGNER